MWRNQSYWYLNPSGAVLYYIDTPLHAELYRKIILEKTIFFWANLWTRDDDECNNTIKTLLKIIFIDTGHFEKHVQISLFYYYLPLMILVLTKMHFRNSRYPLFKWLYFKYGNVRREFFYVLQWKCKYVSIPMYSDWFHYLGPPKSELQRGDNSFWAKYEYLKPYFLTEYSYLPLNVWELKTQFFRSPHTCLNIKPKR